MSMDATDTYGAPSVVSQPAAATAGPPTDHREASDPHDKSDRGPGHWLDDPVVWLVIIFGIATGALGIRFKWWSGGAEAGVRVNVADELVTLAGTTLYAITGIVIFKLIASKTNIRGLQSLAAAV